MIQEFIKEYKRLISDERYFLGFGKYTEPHKDCLLASFVSQLKQNPFDIIPLIDMHFQPLKQVPDSFLTVKKMEDQKIVGSCSEYAFLTAAALRLAGYPSAILLTLRPRSVFQKPEGPEPYEDHVVVLSKIDGHWYLIDSQAKIVSRFIFTKLFSMGLLPAAILKDPADLNLKGRRDVYGLLLYRLKDYMMVDIQKDIVNPLNWSLYERYVHLFRNKK